MSSYLDKTVTFIPKTKSFNVLIQEVAERGHVISGTDRHGRKFTQKCESGYIIRTEKFVDLSKSDVEAVNDFTKNPMNADSVPVPVPENPETNTQ